MARELPADELVYPGVLGRTLDAKYQWAQALTLKPEDDQAITLKAKIADGLPDSAGTKSAQDRTTQAGQKTPQ